MELDEHFKLMLIVHFILINVFKIILLVSSVIFCINFYFDFYTKSEIFITIYMHVMTVDNDNVFNIIFIDENADVIYSTDLEIFGSLVNLVRVV